MHIPLTTRDFIDRAEFVYGDTVGVVDEPDLEGSLTPLSYRDVASRARAIHAGLDTLRVPIGARVAVVSPNSARLLELILAVPSAGRVLVPINFRLNADEVSYIVDDCAADVLLVDPELNRSLGGVSARHRMVLGRDSDELLDFDADAPLRPQIDESDIATLNYTSGTTGKPKGVCITHRNIWINTVVLGMHMQLSDQDVLLHVLPMFHCNGWGMPYVSAAMGVRQVVMRTVNGAEILRRVDSEGVTIMCGAPTVWRMVLEAAQQWDGPIPGRGLVRIVCAGAAPPAAPIVRIERELGWEFNQIYGLSETSPLLAINRPRTEYQELSEAGRAAALSRAGAPSLGTTLRVDEHGEVQATSNTVMDGYWNQPEQTAAALGSGWFHTGDAGVLGDDGYLTITDRKKDIIITGGENVSSLEVEDALCGHAAVADAAVIGTPHEHWGELVTAVVVLCDNEILTEADLIDYARSRLAHYKVPRRILFRGDIPYTSTGKKQKYSLRAQLAAP